MSNLFVPSSEEALSLLRRNARGELARAESTEGALFENTSSMASTMVSMLRFRHSSTVFFMM